MSRPRVLIVEDEGVTAMALEHTLASLGYAVAGIESTEQGAVEKADGECPDVVLMDVMLSGGGDGIRAAKRIRAAHADIPIVYLTALGDDATLKRANEAGANGYVVKPYRAVDLRAAIEGALSSMAASRDQRAEISRSQQGLDDLTRAMHHDLRSPLRALEGFSQSLLQAEASTLGEGAKADLRRVRAAAQRMSALIDAMLELDRVARAPLVVEPIDLARVAKDIAAGLLATSPQRQVEFRIKPDLVVQGDAQLVRLLLVHLIENAWKFTSGRPRATIEVGRQAAGSRVAYFVRDDGAGFDPAHRDKLFIPFERLHGTAEFPGLGMGLAIARRIAERHGWTLEATGAVGKGAEFSFSVPAPQP